MQNESSQHRRNLFEVDNARNLSKQELVDTFIPTQSFWRLLSAKHHIVLGARGQGKTALAKMLSHDHLSLLAQHYNEPRAQSAIRNQEFIGIYLPTRLEWVGGLRNKSWLNDKEREELFQWRLNIASCIAFTSIAKSCISSYITSLADQARTEKELSNLLSNDWLTETESNISNLLQLRRHLEDVDYRRQIQILRIRAIGSLPEKEIQEGIVFNAELFTPLRQGMRQLTRLLDINPNCTWMICIDEAEFLDEMDQRIINSHMRAYPDNLFIKMTTMPYCHYTLATNIGPDLINGHDFQYVNLESIQEMNINRIRDRNNIGAQFGRMLFNKLLEASGPQIAEFRNRKMPNLSQVLGRSEILDPQFENWDDDSSNMQLLTKYASKETIDRANQLKGTTQFRDEIGRKIHGALLLRKEVDELRGNRALTAYSGASMILRCADGNPRYLIRIFNSLFMLLSKGARRSLRIKKANWISPSDQTRALSNLSYTTLNQVKSIPQVGPELYDFLCMLGNYMKAYFHDKPLTTDQITSVTIDNTISDEEWSLVQTAVGYGLLYPNVNPGNLDEIPWREGTFHLAYVLAPYFYLLPRRGKAAKLTTIKSYNQMTHKQKKSLIQYRQLQMFEDGDSHEIDTSN